MKKHSNCRICRRVGEKLFLKGEKCNLPNCPVAKRSYAPGQTGAKRNTRRGSDYSVQLLEKQKARAIYGVSEKQMANYFHEARKTKSATGETLMKMLESRLDNVVYRLGWAESRDQARQLVSHGKILLNDKKVKIASLQVKISDKIRTLARDYNENKQEIPNWLKKEKNSSEGEVIGEAKLDDTGYAINEQLIIEYYSR
ncbi:MAG: 30S ribosomal protein S4 [Candidatus Berkelbacteria bacterium]|nr:30S ribosomal protein S4 [Candidatus Berkelbacteria bacterium]